MRRSQKQVLVFFSDLPEDVQEQVVRQAYKDKDSQIVVKHEGRLISVPLSNVYTALSRLGYTVVAEMVLLK
jgi:hypothetical protein